MYLKKIPGSFRIALIPAFIVIFLGISFNNIFRFSHYLSQISNPFTHTITLTSSLNPKDIEVKIKALSNIESCKIYKQHNNNLSAYIKTTDPHIHDVLMNCPDLTATSITPLPAFSLTFIKFIRYFLYLFIVLIMGFIFILTRHFVKYNLQTFETILLLGSTKHRLVKKIQWYFLKKYLLGTILGMIVMFHIIVLYHYQTISKDFIFSLIREFSSILMFVVIPCMTFIVSAFISLIVIRQTIYK